LTLQLRRAQTRHEGRVIPGYFRTRLRRDALSADRYIYGYPRRDLITWQKVRACDAALALACSGDPLLMRRALGMLHDLGAQPAAAVVARRLRSLGARGLPRGSRPTTAANPASLTTRQVEVLTLLAAGLANPEIAERLVLSDRTVDNHVSAILRKLGVRNRADARAAALRLGLVPGVE
jgi:DNA-binding NarL/FixJ family response regulator